MVQGGKALHYSGSGDAPGAIHALVVGAKLLFEAAQLPEKAVELLRRAKAGCEVVPAAQRGHELQQTESDVKFFWAGYWMA